MRSSQRGLVWILLAAAFVLLLVAVVAVALYFVLRQRPIEADSWQDPVGAIAPGEITADLALYPMAGASELETIDAAIANGDFETGYAALVFSLELSDAQRIGRLILLGRGFAETERPERAARCYQQVYDLAVTSPRLNDPARADALLASGRGWAGLGFDAQATITYDQVYVIAIYSPFLQMANRRELLNGLKIEYGDAGDEARAEVCQQQIVRLDQESQQPPAVPPQVPDLPQGEESVSTDEVGTLEEARRQAAYDVIESLSRGEPAPARLGSLAQALMAENAAKVSLYDQVLEGTSQPGKRISAHWEMIRWLTLKYEVAARGFGLSLVPDWEAGEAEIESDLSKAYEDLFFDYEDLVTALPEASLIGPGSYLVRRQVTLAGRLGQYPNYPEQQMVDKLRESAGELAVGGAESQLFVDAIAEDGGLRFFLNPADHYGQPPQSP
jgi:tetratricopeptide (TPR) repeat protein